MSGQRHFFLHRAGKYSLSAMELLASFTDAYSVPFTVAYSDTDADIGAIAHPFTVPLAYTLTVAIASYAIYTCIDC